MWALGIAASLLVAGCSASTTGSGGSSSAAAGSSAGNATVPPTGAPSPSAAGAGSGGPAGGAPAAVSGQCRLIALAAATDLLGTTPKQTAAPVMPPQDDEGVRITKVDGCSYSADPSLGYDVLRIEGAGSAAMLVAAAKGRMAAQAEARSFAVGLGDDSLGFTVAVGAKTMARIEVAKGATEIAVAVTATDAGKAQSVALEAARRLVAAAG